MDVDTKDPEVIVLDEEDCPFTIITVKIGEDGAIEETNEPVINLDPVLQPTNNAQNCTIGESNEPFIKNPSLDPEIHSSNKAQNHTLKETNEAFTNFDPGIHATNNEPVNDSSETDNSDDWTDESPVNITPIQPKTKRKRRRKGPHVCPHCGKTFSQGLHLTDHIMTHTGEKPFKCLICNLKFVQRSNLNRHIHQHHPSAAPLLMTHKITQSFNCWGCKSSFDTHYDYTKHMQSHRNAWGHKQSSSLQLGDTFHMNPSSDSEDQSDAAEITYSCAFCDHEYPDEESLASHMQCHTGVQSPISVICKDEQSEAHVEHQKEQNTDEYTAPLSPRSFSCKYCGKPCCTKQKLSYHERTHRIKRTFHCSSCRRGFNKREAYDRHLKLHSARAAGQTEHQKEAHVGEYSTQQSAKTFACKYCGKPFSTAVSLSYHERTHRIQRSFHCSMCNRGFNQRRAYDRHMREHCRTAAATGHHKEEDDSQNRPLSCEYCGKPCTTEQNLSYHERTHKIKRSFRCPVCQRGFKSKEAYEQHISQHSSVQATLPTLEKLEESVECAAQHSLKWLYCKYCGKQCKTNLSLSYHERTHKIKRTFCCSICTRGFNSQQAYDRHITKHQNRGDSEDGHSAQQTPKPFSCIDCGARFSSGLRLTEHEKTHIIQMAFYCSVCSKGFNRRQTYERHLKVHSAKPAVQPEHLHEEEMEDSAPQSLESFHCGYCGKQCDTKLSLSYHERTHRIKRMFCCPVCNKGFNKKQAYVRHLGRHSFKTAVKTEHQEEDLFNSHTENHSKGKPKPFRCEECGVKFTAKHYLVRHMKCHTSDPYFCKHCDKNFTTKAACVIHMKSHILAMPYSCSICNEKFKVAGRLTQHMKIHGVHDFEPYSCSICQSNSCFHKEDAIKPFSGKDCEEKSGKEHLRLHSAKPAENLKVEERGDAYSAQQNPKDCGMQFSKKLSLKFHMRMHKSSFPFSCSVCNMTFKGRHLHEEHMRMHSREVGSASGSGQSLDEELQSNPGEIIFSCPPCDKELQTEQELKTHMDGHKSKDPKLFSCGAKFTEKQRLESHMEVHDTDKMKIHTEERRYSCTVCNKKFNCRDKLENHTRLHVGVRPFSCPVCFRKFSTDYNLQRHLSFHKKHSETGESPFSCSDGASLEFHRKTSAFSCSVCGRGFKIREVYELHVKTHQEERETDVEHKADPGDLVRHVSI